MAVQDTATVPITLLQAVNEMLAAVGRGPVTSTDPAAAGTEAGKAIAIISDTSVQVQERGWWFNEEYEYPLSPSPVDGTIILPINCLKVRNSIHNYPKQQRPQADRNRTFTMRGLNGSTYLYDMANQTFSWCANSDGYAVAQPLVTGNLVVDMTLAYPFEDIPQAIRWLITCQAGRDWAVGRVPDMNTYRFTDAVLQQAEADAQNFDREMRPSQPTESPHFKMMRRR